MVLSGEQLSQPTSTAELALSTIPPLAAASPAWHLRPQRAAPRGRRSRCCLPWKGWIRRSCCRRTPRWWRLRTASCPRCQRGTASLRPRPTAAFPAAPRRSCCAVAAEATSSSSGYTWSLQHKEQKWAKEAGASLAFGESTERQRRIFGEESGDVALGFRRHFSFGFSPLDSPQASPRPPPSLPSRFPLQHARRPPRTYNATCADEQSYCTCHQENDQQDAQDHDEDAVAIAGVVAPGALGHEQTRRRAGGAAKWRERHAGFRPPRP
eukprot:scaffold510_cov242-Pinguiococcus_pyrenoidosus.AAC.25